VYLISGPDGEGREATLMSNYLIGLYDLNLKSSLVLTNNSVLL